MQIIQSNKVETRGENLSAGICDACSVPKMKNTGDGINEPPDPILYCSKMNREICPEPPSERMTNCAFFKQRL